jgi:hypothetical protein
MRVRVKFALLASLCLLFACGDAQSNFIGSRLLDACNGNWPVCTLEAGCVVGNGQYVTGVFPGTLRMVTQIQAPTTVEIDIFLTTEGAVGTTTTLTWFETGCGSDYTDAVAGKDLFAQFDASGVFTASEQLVEPGDHLIEVDSDATADYDLKLVLTPQGCP